MDITDLMETEAAPRQAREELEVRVAARTSELARAHRTRTYILAHKTAQTAARLANTAIEAAETASTPAMVRRAAKLAATTGRAGFANRCS